MGLTFRLGQVPLAIFTDSSNNVGIGGAANASFKLQVTGSVNLEGNVTTTGAQFVQNGFYLTNANGGSAAGYTNMWGATDGIFFGLRNGTGGGKFIFQSATSYDYTFPAATGTLALLEGTQTFSGSKTFSVTTIQDAGIVLKDGVYPTPSTGYVGFASNGAGVTIVRRSGVTSYNNNFQFPLSSNDYNFPNATGTIALTSDLSAYLPLTGGTLTGALSGTSASFSSSTASSTTTNGALVVAGGVGIGGEVNIAGTTIFGTSATPNSKFYIYGGFSTNLNLLQNYNGSAYTTEEHRASDYSYKIGTTTALTIASTGAATFSSNVAIGGTNSTWNLTTSNRLQIGNSILANYGTTATILGMNLTFDGSWKYISNGLASLFSQDTGDHIFFTSASSTAGSTATLNERMRITNGGNVGIGTSSPTSNYGFEKNLTIASANNAELQLSQTANSHFLSIGITNGFNFFQTTAGQGYAYYIGGTERMRITSGGELYWNLTGTSAGNLNTGGALFRNNLGKYIQLSTGLTTDASLMIFYKSDGAGGVTNTGSISTSGNSTAYNTTSDYRIKEDLQDFNGIEKILAIKMYDFAWKSDNTRSYGVMAHELAEVLPYAVYGKKDAIQEDGEIQLQQVDYSKIVPILVKSIQELEARIKQLENK
jgi:hypothetical protein